MLQEFELLFVSLRTLFASVDTCSILPTGMTAASLNKSLKRSFISMLKTFSNRDKIRKTVATPLFEPHWEERFNAVLARKHQQAWGVISGSPTMRKKNIGENRWAIIDLLQLESVRFNQKKQEYSWNSFCFLN